MSVPVFPEDLSMRERQAVEIVARLGRATARDIQDELPDPPTYSAVRSILRILVNKGILIKQQQGTRDWYAVKAPAQEVRSSVLKKIVRSFFGNSAVDAACALLGEKEVKLSREEADRLMRLIREAREK